MSVGLDSLIKFWQNNNCIHTVQLDYKIITAEFFNGVAVLGLSNEKIAIFDMQTI
jgi:hypothetical protein